MTHLSLDRLAGHALSTDDPLTPAEQNHLVNCAECREELAELSRIAELSGEPEHTDSQPVQMESIWHSIQANIVDVSIEPYDGNPAHSRNSQVRGVLPT